jgi:hypothetical protein
MKDGSQMEFNPSGSGIECLGWITNFAHQDYVGIHPPQLALEYAVYRVSGGRYVALSWVGARSARAFRGQEVSRVEAAAEFMKDGLSVPPDLLPPSGEALVPVTLGGDSVLQHNNVNVTAVPGCGNRPAGGTTLAAPLSEGKAQAKPAPDDEQDPALQPGSDAGDPAAPASSTSPVRTMPRWNQWALGLEAGNKWHLFRRIKGQWQQEKLFRGISQGRQATLMEAFAEHGGCLRKIEALKLERATYSSADVEKLMGLIKPELTKLRAAICKAIGIRDPKADPLPFINEQSAWRAEIEIGYAVQQDGEHVGGEKRLRFKTREEMTEA